VGVSQHLDLFEARRVERKGSLNANAMGGDAPYGKVGVGASAPAHAHHGSAHQLNSFPLALDDTEMDPHIVTDPEAGVVRFQSDVVLQLLFFN
jgi:hypothetical protein